MGRLETLAMVMAGGKGERLYPLTRERAKPAVPFGGKYRLIDFVLSNLVHSEIRAICVLTQYKAQSLTEHVQRAWPHVGFSRQEFVTCVPAQMRTGDLWYRGTADAIYQNINLIRDNRPEMVAVFGSDHVYRMDIRQMIAFHRERNADATVATVPVPADQSTKFGIVEADAQGRMVGFEEKPKVPKTILGRPDRALGSMGNYIFRTEFLQEILTEDATKETAHDFGKTILPAIYRGSRVFAYDFSTNQIAGRAKGEETSYWRDVGSIGSYFDANMDLKNPTPIFNLYNRDWPIITANYSDPPAKFVFDEEGRRGVAVHSLVCMGAILSGARADDSIIGRNVFLRSFSQVKDCIFMDGAEVGRHCRLRRVIVDKNVKIPPNTVIGYDRAQDEAKYFVDPASGIVVLPKDTAVAEDQGHG